MAHMHIRGTHLPEPNCTSIQVVQHAEMGTICYSNYKLLGLSSRSTSTAKQRLLIYNQAVLESA